VHRPEHPCLQQVGSRERGPEVPGRPGLDLVQERLLARSPVHPGLHEDQHRLGLPRLPVLLVRRGQAGLLDLAVLLAHQEDHHIGALDAGQAPLLRRLRGGG
jgi:hypothetical protein